MELSRRGIALATAALQVAAMNRAARAEPALPARSSSIRRGRRTNLTAQRRVSDAAKG
ncbi:MAG: hypothetical protein K5Q68_21635 [Roseococcus sp.]|nr:hypothetical protein [Roseococcus sp.]